MKTILPCSIFLLLAVGCAGPGISASHREPYIKPGLIMLTADQAAERGIAVQPAGGGSTPLSAEIEALDESAVLTSPGIKVYTINRTVDPADRNLLHEQHVVYRRESAPQWRLHAAFDRRLNVGPSVPDGRQNLQPLLDKELATFLSDQRRATEANQRSITALFQVVDALSRQQQTVVPRTTGGTPTVVAPEPGDVAPAGHPAPKAAE